jgi:hypothetical protein
VKSLLTALLPEDNAIPEKLHLPTWQKELPPGLFFLTRRNSGRRGAQ